MSDAVPRADHVPSSLSLSRLATASASCATALRLPLSRRISFSSAAMRSGTVVAAADGRGRAGVAEAGLASSSFAWYCSSRSTLRASTMPWRAILSNAALHCCARTDTFSCALPRFASSWSMSLPTSASEAGCAASACLGSAGRLSAASCASLSPRACARCRTAAASAWVGAATACPGAACCTVGRCGNGADELGRASFASASACGLRTCEGPAWPRGRLACSEDRCSSLPPAAVLGVLEGCPRGLSWRTSWALSDGVRSGDGEVGLTVSIPIVARACVWLGRCVGEVSAQRGFLSVICDARKAGRIARERMRRGR